MKAKIHLPLDREVTITLKESEAKLLRTLVGSIAGGYGSPLSIDGRLNHLTSAKDYRVMTQHLFNALIDAGVETAL